MADKTRKNDRGPKWSVESRLKSLECSLIPSLKVKYLGYFSESDKQSFTLPPNKVHIFAALRDSILGLKSVTLRSS